MIIDPLVNIVMPTYNHDKYISQAIESVLMQQCSFNYQIIIGEDYSKDTTREICKKYQKDYPKQILLLENEVNLGLIRNYKKILDVCTAKYLAILESDDFWIDPFKLQKQVDILEADESIGVVHSCSYVLYEDGTMKQTLVDSNFNNWSNDSFLNHMKNGISIVPLTAVFRRNLYIKHIDIDWAVKNEIWTFDSFLWLGLINHTKKIQMKECTGVYRILKSSISNTDKFEKIESKFHTTLLIKQYYLNKYSIVEPLSVVTTHEFSFITQKALESKLFDKAKSYGNKINVKNIKTLKMWLFSRSPFFYPLFKLDLFIFNFLSKHKQILLRNRKLVSSKINLLWQ